MKLLILKCFRGMFFVELNEGDDGEEDEIDKSIKEIHQSAQKLSISNCNPASFPSAAPTSSLPQGESPIMSNKNVHPNLLIGLDGEAMSANIELKERSSTLKSNFTDYDTPPETPEFRIDRLVG